MSHSKPAKTAKHTKPLSAIGEAEQREFLEGLVSQIDVDERDPGEIAASIKAYFSLSFAKGVSYGGSTLEYIKKLGTELKIAEWPEILAILDPPKSAKKADKAVKAPAAAAAAAPAPQIQSQELDQYELDAEALEAEAKEAAEAAQVKAAAAKDAKKVAKEAASVKAQQDKMKRRKERQEEAAAAAAAKEAAKLAGKKRPAEAKKEPPAKEAKGDGGQDWILDPAIKNAYDFCRHHKIIKLSGKKTEICPAEIGEEAFDEKDDKGEGWNLTPAQIAKLVEFGFIADDE